MTSVPGSAGPPASTAQPGRLGRALVRMFMRHARVTEAEAVADGLRLITLESPGFRAIHWTPGQKVQIAMGSAFVARTFTPIEWDAQAGRTRILGCMHGHGPGSAWVRDTRPGAECDVFGPRASLDISRAAGMHVVLGDETSIGLVCALQRHAPGGPVRSLLEVSTAASAREALTRLALDGVELFQRTAGEAHLQDIAHRLPPLVAAGAGFVLTGRASAIGHLRRVLRSLGVPASLLATKPHWAPGRTGLD